MRNSVAAALVASLGLYVVCGPTWAAQCGGASYYCCEHHGRPTASGAIFNENKLTAAMMGRKNFGRWLVTHNGKSVIVKVNDTGNFAKYGRIIDLSKAAFRELASLDRGVIRVCLERIGG